MNTARSSNDIGPSQPTFAATVSFNDPATDQAPVATAKMGDEEAFETLVKRHRTRIFSLALRYTRVREDAEDVVQQTFQKSMRLLEQLRREFLVLNMVNAYRNQRSPYVFAQGSRATRGIY